jgi:hypothetical protein
MADPSAPVPVPSPAALGRRKKNVLIPFGGKSQLAANRQLFEWSALHLFEPGDNVFVFHYLRKSAFATVSGVVSASSPGGGSSSAAVAAIAAAHPQRPGFTVVNIDAPLPPPATATAAADTKKEEKKEEEKEEGKEEKAKGEAVTAEGSNHGKGAAVCGDNCGDYMTTTIADEEAAAAAAGINDPAEAEWLPRAVSDALRAHRAACPSSFVVVFQIDSAAGPGSAEVRDTPLLPLLSLYFLFLLSREIYFLATILFKFFSLCIFGEPSLFSVTLPRKLSPRRHPHQNLLHLPLHFLSSSPPNTTPSPSPPSSLNYIKKNKTKHKTQTTNRKKQEAIVEMCKGTFESPADPSHLAVPRPDLVCVGSRGGAVQVESS